MHRQRRSFALLVQSLARGREIETGDGLAPSWGDEHALRYRVAAWIVLKCHQQLGIAQGGGLVEGGVVELNSGAIDDVRADAAISVVGSTRFDRGAVLDCRTDRTPSALCFYRAEACVSPSC